MIVQVNKRAELRSIQVDIQTIIDDLEHLRPYSLELNEYIRILEKKLSELRQKESKLLAKVKPV